MTTTIRGQASATAEPCKLNMSTMQPSIDSHSPELLQKSLAVHARQDGQAVSACRSRTSGKGWDGGRTSKSRLKSDQVRVRLRSSASGSMGYSVCEVPSFTSLHSPHLTCGSTPSPPLLGTPQTCIQLQHELTRGQHEAMLLQECCRLREEVHISRAVGLLVSHTGEIVLTTVGVRELINKSNDMAGTTCTAQKVGRRSHVRGKRT